MPDPDSPEARRGPAAANRVGAAAGLSRSRILDAAIELIDQTGLRGFTMRRLGTHVGVEAMAFYHYFSSRENVLDGVVEVVVDKLYEDPEVTCPRRTGRSTSTDLPTVFVESPWPTRRSSRWWRPARRPRRGCGRRCAVFAGSSPSWTTCCATGSDRAAVAGYQAFSSFLLGHLLLEVSAQGADLGPVPENEPDPHDVDPADLDGYPTLKRLTPQLTEDRSAQEFDEALEALLDRLEINGKQ